MFKSKKIKNSSTKTKTSKKADPAIIENQKILSDFYTPEDVAQPKKKRVDLVWPLVISVLFGFFSGCLALFLFFSGAFSNSPMFNWLDIDSLMPTSSVVIEKKEEVTVAAENRLQDVQQKTSESIVGVFNSTAKNNFYNFQNYLGSGLVLTSDGWLVATNDVISDTQKNYTVITRAGEILPVQEFYFENNLGLVYLKVKAQDLPVLSFTDFSEVNLGEQVILLNGLTHLNQNIAINFLSSKTFQLSDKEIRNSEDRYLFFSLDQSIKNNFIGAVAVNLEKKLIGLVTQYNAQKYLIPAEYIENSFKKFLDNDKKITSAYLGLEYINLSQNLSSGLGQMGALIEKVAKNSPLYNHAQSGDILIQVNDQIINGNKNLTNCIQEYKTGDTLRLVFIDKESQKEKKIEVELK